MITANGVILRRDAAGGARMAFVPIDSTNYCLIWCFRKRTALSYLHPWMNLEESKVCKSVSGETSLIMRENTCTLVG